MGLFKPAWQSQKAEKALQAVNSITDQALLAEIAANSAALAEVRKVAVERIADQQLLAGIASNKTNMPQIQMIAIKKITDQALLKTIAADGAVSIEVKKAAIAKINDEQTIKYILQASSHRTQLIGTIRDSNLRNWAIIMYEDKPKKVIDLLLQICREDLLVELVDRIYDIYRYNNAEETLILVQKKSNMPKFIDALMKKWFERNCRLVNDYGGQMEPGDHIVWSLTRYFRNIPWSAYCPAEFPNIIIKHGKYQKAAGMTITIAKETASEIAYVLETLFRERADFREQILALDGYLLYGGREGGFVGGTGDHETGFGTDASPPQHLQIKALSPDSIEVSVSNT